MCNLWLLIAVRDELLLVRVQVLFLELASSSSMNHLGDARQPQENLLLVGVLFCIGAIFPDRGSGGNVANIFNVKSGERKRSMGSSLRGGTSSRNKSGRNENRARNALTSASFPVISVKIY